MKNFTVFDQLELDFSSGINVFVGVNGKGKTHIMKVLYSACQAVDKKVSFYLFIREKALPLQP